MVQHKRVVELPMRLLGMKVMRTSRFSVEFKSGQFLPLVLTQFGLLVRLAEPDTEPVVQVAVGVELKLLELFPSPKVQKSEFSLGNLEPIIHLTAVEAERVGL
jgi:hypothetical protein